MEECTTTAVVSMCTVTHVVLYVLCPDVFTCWRVGVCVESIFFIPLFSHVIRFGLGLSFECMVSNGNSAVCRVGLS